ncbi:MAG: Crp/Fnr family transcriptional regulator [Cyanobacteria bacterium J06638_22]
MAQSANIAQLKELSLFASLDDSLLETFALHNQLTSYAQGDIVFHEGDLLPACLHVLVSGRLHIAKIAPSGKETILRILPPGELFAAPAIFGTGTAPATATAIEPATVLRVEQQVLLDGFSQTPALALHLLGVLNQRLQQLHNQVHGLVSERAVVRLVNYLEYLADSSGIEVVDGGEQVRSRANHYQIARSIGVTYEESVRLFKQLQAVVTYQRGGIITIRDRQKLRAISASN